MSSLEGEARMAAVAGDRSGLQERSETRDEKEARQEADRRNLWQTPIHDPQPRSLRRVALLPL